MIRYLLGYVLYLFICRLVGYVLYRIRFRVDFFKRIEVCYVIDIILLSINLVNLVYFYFSEINKVILET